MLLHVMGVRVLLSSVWYLAIVLSSVITIYFATLMAVTPHYGYVGAAQWAAIDGWPQCWR